MVDPSSIVFQGKHEDEVYQMHYYRHWIDFVGPFIWLVLLNIIIFVGFYQFFWVIVINNPIWRQILLWSTILVFLSVHLNFLRIFYRRFLYVVVITNKRVHRIRKTLLLLDEHRSVDLVFLQDMRRCKSGIFQNLLNYGDMKLEAQESVLELHYVPYISKTHEQLLYLWEQAKRQRR